MPAGIEDIVTWGVGRVGGVWGLYRNGPWGLGLLTPVSSITASLGERPGKLGAAPDLPETYSSSTTKSRSDIPSSKDRSRGRSRPHRRDSSNGDRPQSRDCSLGVRKSYDNSHSSYGTGTYHGYRYRDRDRSRHVKRGRDSESSLSRVSESGSSDGGHWKSKSKRHKPTDEDDLRCYGCVKRGPRGLRKKFPSDSMGGMLGNAYMVSYVQLYPNRGRKSMEKPPSLVKRKVTHHREHRTSQSGTLQRKGLTSQVSQGKEGGLAALPPYKDTKRNSRGRGKKVPAATTYEITFPSLATSSGTEGPLVIEAEIGRHMIHRMYVDGGSSTEVLYEHCFNRLQPEVKNQMVPTTTSLTSFSGETIWPLGQLRLLVTIGDAGHSTRAWMNFMIIRSLSSYNGIIGRPRIKEIQAVPSTTHEMLKFPADGGIVTIRSTILIPAECATVITSSKEIPKEAGVRHENFKVDLHPNFPDQEVAIGGTLSAKGRTELCSLLKENLDIFAWQPSDMTGVSRSDCYPLPEIDWKVKSLCGYPFNCFLDAYKGYHQIQLAESDEDKTAFHTGQGVYCYTKMPFGLKNVGATYQRLVDKAFDSQIGQKIEVYVDDLVIKSHTEAEMLRDIGETFRTLRKINMKLNLKKCTFEAVEGMFLGYMITLEGIKSCPDKTKAVLQLPSPRTSKEVQSFNGKLASLNRFLSKTSEAKQAFKQLKQHLSELPLLVAPKPKEELIVYLSASYGAISAVLMTEKGTIQTPVYFISRTLQGPTITKIERHARRTQYHIPDKDVGERTRPSGFPRRNTGRKSAKRTSSRNSTRAMDTLHGWIVMCGWVWCWSYTDKPGGNGIGVRNVHVSVDSKLVANQVLGAYIAKEENMIKYLEKVKSLVLVEILKEKSIQEKEVTTVVEEDGPTWMTPIIEYLKKRTLPGDRKEASKLRIKARQYELLEGVLYRRSFLTPWLRCVGPLQANYVIREIHEGSCSMHAGSRSVVAKAIRLGYYWPTMHRDARDMIRACNGKVRFLLVDMDYFTKWIEAKAVATITDNQSLGEGIKARLGEGNNNWIEELAHILWAHRTIIKSSHGDTPFSLTYGTKAVIPAEIRMPTYRTAAVEVVHNDEELRLNLDFLEERRERAAIREAKAKLKMTKYYNVRVHGVTFRPVDFFYRSNDATHAVDGGKLISKWEGPYEVTKALGDRAYKLRSADETVLPRTWNVANLKKCYL
nr:reverse transcriptase domain-containing protein [Tanacetum cinerariifolium]